ncbi:hypothetical protein RRG08_030762 [Elysia crispata]|uniref:Uncharacterized protein n=1 Tax=Elysia crispata TaxID=231223 RepID=A0AAE0YF49_9GAST|nr:hypothetical protein RRG08_030762 [Elysia crispata]
MMMLRLFALGALLGMPMAVADCPQSIETCKTAYDVQKETVGVSCTSVLAYMNCIPTECFTQEAFPESLDSEMSAGLRERGIHCNFIQTNVELSKCSLQITQCQQVFAPSSEYCGAIEKYLTCIKRVCPITNYLPNVACAETENSVQVKCDLCNGQTSLQKSGLTASVVIIASIIIRFFFADL